MASYENKILLAAEAAIFTSKFLEENRKSPAGFITLEVTAEVRMNNKTKDKMS